MRRTVRCRQLDPAVFPEKLIRRIQKKSCRLGLGADFTRNFNMSLVYTNYVYFNELYWSEGTLYYDASRSDTLMLGAEVRF